MVPGANTSVSVPELIVRLDKLASVESAAALVMVMVYVFVVVPSCAVTTVVIILLPTLNTTFLDVPLIVGVPFTVIVALALLAVGVTSTDVTLLATDAV
jgi:hypothetical protein